MARVISLHEKNYVLPMIKILNNHDRQEGIKEQESWATKEDT